MRRIFLTACMLFALVVLFRLWQSPAGFMAIAVSAAMFVLLIGVSLVALLASGSWKPWQRWV
jgi:hypothetical protein